jgi:hypothetical protein
MPLFQLQTYKKRLKAYSGDNMKTYSYFSRFCIALFILVAAMLSATAKDAPVNQFEDTTQVEGQNLVLNGVGPYAINRVKMYTVGIYLSARKTSAAEILALPGTVRVKLVMLKTVESETMSRRFIADIHANTSKDDRLKIAPQILTMGMAFGTVGDWNVGDIMTIDWLPGKGAVMRLNGKQVMEAFKEPLVMQSILKIWMGENVYDNKLKKLLVGDKD